LPNGGSRIDLSALNLESMSFAGFFAALFLAQGTQGGTVPDPRASALQMIGPLVLMVVVMYVIIFRPQQKKAKEHAALLKTLKRGDKVVTSGGILGMVTHVKDNSVIVDSGDSKVEILKSAVSQVTERSGAAAA
jgi:preprotein translocase subunit YajC